MKALTLLIFLSFLHFPIYCQEKISDLLKNSKNTTTEFQYKYLEILDLNVFNYFELKEYDTELKKMVYKRTEDYKIKLNELLQVKDSLLKQVFYSTRSLENVDYNIELGGFKVPLGFDITDNRKTPKEDPKFWNQEVLFFKLSEEDGLEIENDKKNVAIYFFYTIGDVDNGTFDYSSGWWGTEYGWKDKTKKKIKTKVRVVLANKAINKIYYNNSLYILNI